MQTRRLVVTYTEGGETYYLENTFPFRLVPWVPSNFYSTELQAWWALYAAIEYGEEAGIEVYGDRSSEVEVIRDRSHDMFYIGSYEIVPVTLNLHFEEKVQVKSMDVLNLSELEN